MEVEEQSLPSVWEILNTPIYENEREGQQMNSAQLAASVRNQYEREVFNNPPRRVFRSAFEVQDIEAEGDPAIQTQNSLRIFANE